MVMLQEYLDYLNEGFNLLDLLNEYTQRAKVHSNIQYGSKSSVKNGNESINKMIHIAKTIKKMGNAAIQKFSKLLNNKITSIYCAHHLIEVIGVTGKLKDKAISIIKGRSKDKGPNAKGEEMWLSQNI